MNKTVSLLGAGNMGGAIVLGMLNTKFLPPDNIMICDKIDEKRKSYAALGCRTTDKITDAASSDCIIIAVKPQQITEAAELAPLCEGKLIISIAAGVTLETLSGLFPNSSIVRVMPNTPLITGEGVSALCRNDNVSDEDFNFAKAIFSCAGTAFELDEKLLNPLTALTSSAVAYYARVISAMANWAERNGFDNFERSEIVNMVVKTALGTSKLLSGGNITPEALVKAVASPGGTTERALSVFDNEGLDKIFSDAMDACLSRADELSGK